MFGKLLRSAFSPTTSTSFDIVALKQMDGIEDHAETLYGQDHILPNDPSMAKIFGQGPVTIPTPSPRCWVIDGPNGVVPVTPRTQLVTPFDPDNVIFLETGTRSISNVDITIPTFLWVGKNFTGVLRCRAACCDEDLVVIIADAEDGDKAIDVKTTQKGDEKYLSAFFEHNKTIEERSCIVPAGTDLKPASDLLKTILTAGYDAARGRTPRTIDLTQKIHAFNYATGACACPPKGFGAAYRHDGD